MLISRSDVPTETKPKKTKKNMNAKLETTLKSLTPLEILALKSAFESSEGNGHDFGYSTDVRVEGKSQKAVGALITNLLKKGLLDLDDEFNQIMFRNFGLAQGEWSGDTDKEKRATAKAIGEWFNF